MNKPTVLLVSLVLVLCVLPVSALSGPLAEGDETIGDVFLISPCHDEQTHPAMAYNDDDDQWLVVWQDNRDGAWTITGVIVDNQGRILEGLLWFDFGNENLRYPAAAYDTAQGRYFVVWQREGDRPAIEGQVIDSKGQAVGDLVKITDGLNARTHPDVAYNPVQDEYLVVLEYQTDAGTFDIWGRKVGVDGTPDPGGKFVIRNTDLDEIMPTLVAYPETSERPGWYLLAWSHNRSGSYNVVGQRLMPDGTPVGNVFTISGGVAPLAGDNFHPGAVVDADNDRALVVWEYAEAGGDRDIYGRLVDITADYLVDPPEQPTGAALDVSRDEGDQTWPAVSYNRDGEYLVVWHDDQDLYGRRVATDATAAANSFAISAAQGTQQIAAVAFGADRHFVTWADSRTGQVDVMGRYLKPEGALLGGEVNLAIAEFSRYDLALAYGTHQEQWFAVWYDQSSWPWRIGGQRVDREGNLVGQPVAITPEEYYEFQPAVAYNPNDDEFLVVWERRFPYDILGQRVSAADGSLQGPLIWFTDDGDWQRSPAVAYNEAAGQYLVVWEDGRDDDGSDTDWNIYGRRLNRDGSFFDDSLLALCQRQANQFNVNVAYNPQKGEQGQYLVVWEDESLLGWGIAGQRVTGTNPWRAGDNVDICRDENKQVNASVACNAANGEYLVVWEDDRDDPGEDGEPTIYGRRLSSTGGLLGSGDIAIANGASGHWVPDVSYDASQNSYFVCWGDSRESSGEGGDIYCQTVSASGSPILTGPEENEAIWPYLGRQRTPVSIADPADGLRLTVWLNSHGSSPGLDGPEVYGVLREPVAPPSAENMVYLPLVVRDQ